MSSAGTDTDPVESVTLELAGLEITVSVRRRRGIPEAAFGPSGIASARTAAGAASAESAQPPVVQPSHFSPGLIRSVLAAETASDFAQLSLPHLSHLSGRLRGGDSQWTAVARLGRAFRAGLLAHQRLSGEVVEGASVGIPYRNTVYIVLRGHNGSAGFWTRDYNIYAQAVFVQVRGQEVFAPESVSHAFASLAEASAFVSGAQVAWPPERGQ